MRGAGRVVFAGILLTIAGTINFIYGIGALDDANVFVQDTRFIFSNLNTLGWVLIILGVLQVTGGLSLLAGNTYGRVIGIAAGTLGAVGAILSIGAGYPWWSLCVFVMCVYVVHGIIVYGEDEVGVPPPRVRRTRVSLVRPEPALGRLRPYLCAVPGRRRGRRASTGSWLPPCARAIARTG